MGGNSDWAVAGIEPSLEEIMSDPIMDLLLCRDGLTKAAVWQLLEAAQSRPTRGRRSAAIPPPPPGLPANDHRAQSRP